MAVRVTAEEVLLWQTMYESGMTIEQVALEVGRTTPTVGRYLRLSGTKMRTPQGSRGPNTLGGPTGGVVGVRGVTRPAIKTVGSYRHHRRRRVMG